jgi:hypothetical protein
MEPPTVLVRLPPITPWRLSQFARFQFSSPGPVSFFTTLLQNIPEVPGHGEVLQFEVVDGAVASVAYDDLRFVKQN